MSTFEDLKISKSVLKAIEELGFTEPTPIQEKAIPMIRSGVDVLGIAQTGTGKTAAYFIPLIMKLVKAEGKDPRAVVLVPTRELAIQVGEDLEDLGQGMIAPDHLAFEVKVFRRARVDRAHGPDHADTA